MSRYKDRIAKGLCGIAGCKETPVPGKPTCESHRKLQAERAATKRAAKQAAGRCIVPGCEETEDISPGGRCKLHRAISAAARKDASTALIDQGLCRNAASHGKAKEGCTLCQDCIDKLSATTTQHYHRQREAGLCGYIGCTKKPANDGGGYCEDHLEYLTERRAQIKLDALNAYGGSACVWNGCNITDPEQLTIDHIEGGGNAHRKEINRAGGSGFMQWLKTQNYPPGYRVLCHNHNHQAHRDRMKKEKP